MARVLTVGVLVGTAALSLACGVFGHKSPYGDDTYGAGTDSLVGTTDYTTEAPDSGGGGTYGTFADSGGTSTGGGWDSSGYYGEDSGGGGGGGSFVPYAFFVSGAFGYDATTGTLESVTVSGTKVPPYVEIQIASSDYFSGYDPRYLCVYDLVYTGSKPITPTTATFTDTESDGTTTDSLTHMYWTMPAGAISFSESSSNSADCHSWSPSFTTMTPQAVLESWTWGTGVGGMRGDVAAYKSSVCTDGSSAVPCVGGGTYWDLLGTAGMDPAYSADGITVGGKVDSSGAVVMSGSSLSWLPAPAMDASKGLATGFYEKLPLYGWDASYLVP